MASHFTFQSAIHFESIFARGVRPVFRCLFSACGYPVALVPFVEEVVLFRCIAPLSKISWISLCGPIFWALYSAPWIILSILLIPH